MFKLLTLLFIFLSALSPLEARGGGGSHGGGSHGGGVSHHTGGGHRGGNHVTVNVGGHGGGHRGGHGHGGGRWYGNYWGWGGPYWCSWFVTDLAIAEAIAVNNYIRLNDGQLANALENARRAVALQDARIELSDEQLENDRLRRQVRDLIDALEKEQRARRK